MHIYRYVILYVYTLCFFSPLAGRTWHWHLELAFQFFHGLQPTLSMSKTSMDRQGVPFIVPHLSNQNGDGINQKPQELGLNTTN